MIMKARKNGRRRLLAFILALMVSTMVVMPTVAVNAVYAQTANPQSLEELFDAEFYARKYPDVASAIGTDKAALYKHFVEIGINEGRTCSAFLNVTQYKNNYPDVAAICGNNWDDVVKHYYSYGISEGRSSFVSSEDLAIENAILAEHSGVAYKSAILSNVDSAILAAAGSDTGYAIDNASGIIAGADGSALIPWDTIQEEGRIQDLEELRLRCGNDLILIHDSNNKIKFVGGRFSNVKVQDETSAIKALDTMAKLYDNDDGRRYLKLSTTGTDSLGNPYYRFVSVDANTEQTNAKYTVTLLADKEGNVLGASNSNSSSQVENSSFIDQKENWGNGMQEYYENADNGFTKLYDGPVKIYDDETKSYYWANYYEKNGVVFEVRVSTSDGKSVASTRFYDAETFHNDPSKSFDMDYEFKNLGEITQKTFIDFYGNTVTLPVAYSEGKGWYIVDEARKMICVESNSSVDLNTVDIFDNHYFNEDYFDAVNAFIADGTGSELIENEKNIITAFTTLQASYDEHTALGLLPEPKTIYVNYIYDATNDNASHRTMNGYILFNINNNAGNSDFAGISHEFGHAVVSNLGQNIPYQAATGAINESYADILGSLIKMIKKKEGKYAGNVDFERWLIGEFLGNDTEHVIRDMSNPANNGHGLAPSPTKVNDEYFVQDTGYYDEDNDWGGAHQNNSILSNICYRMYNEVFAERDENGNSIPDENKYRDLLKVWYDSVIYLNSDSTYADVKGYVLQSMKNHGYDAAMVSQTEQIFNDANVDAYRPFGSQNNTSEEDLATAAKINSSAGEFDGLYNLVEGKANAEDAQLDYEIAYDEYMLAKMQGLTGDALKVYEDNLSIASNAAILAENNVGELQTAFVDSQARLKEMVDDKMAVVAMQEQELQAVSEQKQSNPNLERAYRAMSKGLKTNVDEVDAIIDNVETAASEFKDYAEIANVFKDVWNIDVDNLVDNEGLGYPEDMPADLYTSADVYADGNDSWDYYDLWDDFWNSFWDEFFSDEYWSDVNFDDISWDDFDWGDTDWSDTDWSDNGSGESSDDAWISDEDWDAMVDEFFDDLYDILGL